MNDIKLVEDNEQINLFNQDYNNKLQSSENYLENYEVHSFLMAMRFKKY